MFSVLSGHLIIVPIMSLKRFLCAKYGSFLCVCVLALQRLLRCEFAVKVQSASWFQMHQLLSANPSLHGVTATALVFWGCICVCVCVCVYVCVWACYCGMKASHCWGNFSLRNRKRRPMAAAEVTSKTVHFSTCTHLNMFKQFTQTRNRNMSFICHV